MWRAGDSSKVELKISASTSRAEIRDLLGPLVHEQQDEVNVRAVRADRLGDVLEQDRLARARRREDQPALAASERGDEVDGAHRRRVPPAGLSRMMRSFGNIGVSWSKCFGAVHCVGRDALDGRHPVERHEFFLVARRPQRSGDAVARAQPVLPHHGAGT